MTQLGSIPGSPLRTWLIWTAGFIAFPLAALFGGTVAGLPPLPDHQANDESGRSRCPPRSSTT